MLTADKILDLSEKCLLLYTCAQPLCIDRVIEWTRGSLGTKWMMTRSIKRKASSKSLEGLPHQVIDSCSAFTIFFYKAGASDSFKLIPWKTTIPPCSCLPPHASEIAVYIHVYDVWYVLGHMIQRQSPEILQISKIRLDVSWRTAWTCCGAMFVLI